MVGITPEYVNKIKNGGYKPSQFVCDVIERITEGEVQLISSTSIRKQKKAEKKAFEDAIKKF